MEDKNKNIKASMDNNKRIPYCKPTLGQKSADSISSVMGSWKFLIIQTVFLVIWVMLNAIAWVNHWDPYPFIFLNLMLSFQAAYAAPIILMSQNRAAERDRKKAEADLATDRKAERKIEEVLEQLSRLENSKIKKILEMLEKK